MPRASVRLAALALALVGCRALPDGAPAAACQTMTPDHGALPQKSPLPYSVSPSSGGVAAGQRMQLTIDGGSWPFKGFLVQARRAGCPDSSPPLGTFLPGELVTLVSCSDGSNNAATHANNKAKWSVTLDWEAPADLAEAVVFRVSVAQEYARFWVGHTSSPVTVIVGHGGRQ